MVSLKPLFGEHAPVLRDRNFQLLLLVTVSVPFGNGLISPILDSLIDPFGASASNIGLMVSVFLVPSIIVIPLVGMLADRHGRKPILIPALFIYGGAGTAIVFASDFRIALALRLVQGVGWAGLTTLIVTSIGDFFEGSKEATAQGLRQTGTNLAGAGVSILAGILVIAGWRYPFLLYASAIIVAGIVAVAFQEPTITNSPKASDGGPPIPYHRDLIALMTQPRVWPILSARALLSVVWVGFVTYNSIIIIRLHGGTPTKAGVMYAIASVGVAISASQVGRFSERFGGYQSLLIVANLLNGLGFLFIVFAPSFLIAIIGGLSIGIGMGVALPIYRSLITEYAPPELRGGLVSLNSAGARTLGVLTPLVFGFVIAVLTPMIGSAGALQAVGVSAAVIGGGGGTACVLLSRVVDYDPSY